MSLSKFIPGTSDYNLRRETQSQAEDDKTREKDEKTREEKELLEKVATEEKAKQDIAQEAFNKFTSVYDGERRDKKKVGEPIVEGIENLKEKCAEHDVITTTDIIQKLLDKRTDSWHDVQEIRAFLTFSGAGFMIVSGREEQQRLDLLKNLETDEKLEIEARVELDGKPETVTITFYIEPVDEGGKSRVEVLDVVKKN